MKRLYRGILIILACLCLAVPAFAVDAPISITHDLTSSVPGTGTSRHSFLIHLENRADLTLSALQLRVIPAPPFIIREVVLDVGVLGPHEGTDLEVVLLAPQQARVETLAKRPLLFTGSYTDPRGASVSFPVVSHPSRKGGRR